MSRALTAVVLALVGAVLAAAQTPFVPARLWDKKTPDFRGIWQARGSGHENVERLVVDPPGR